MKTEVPSQHSFLAGGGEMGERLRQYDWSTHPLGSPATWPQALRSALSICLNSSFPTAIYWGPQLRLLYNDAWAPIPAEKHPWALGRPAQEAWPDIWDVIAPQFAQVIATGTGFSTFDQLLPMSRGGCVEETYWNYSLTPIRGEDGSVAGVFNQGHETTAQIMARRDRETQIEHLRDMFQQAPNAVALLNGPSHVYEIANAAYLKLIGHRDVIGKTVGAALPEVVEQGFVELLDQVFRTGEPFIGTAVAVNLQREMQGEWEERLLDFVYQPIRSATGSVTGIFVAATDVTQRTRAEAALRESEERLKLALSATDSIGTWNWDVPHDRVTADEQFARLYGVDAQQAARGVTVTEFFKAVHPDDIERLRQSIADAQRTGESFIREYRLVEQDGTVRWVIAQGRCVLAPDGTPLRFPGLVIDITQRKRAENALRESEERFRLVAESAPVMLWMGDRTGQCIYLNRAQREFWGVASEAVATFNWSTMLHPDDQGTLLEPFSSAMQTQQGFCIEARFRRADGEYRILSTQAQPRFGHTGEFLGMIGVNVDITQTRAAELALRKETGLLEILNRTGAVVAAELDLNRIVQTVTDAGVDLTGAQFGAFFYNVLNDKGESYMLYALSGVPREAFSSFAMPRATAIFQPTFKGEGIVRSDDIMRDARYGKSEPHRGMPKGHLPVRSYLAVPVTSRSGEVLGGLFFGHEQPGVFKAEHEKLLVGIAGQAATAIDNARLFLAAERELTERRRAEEALQALNTTLEQRVIEEVEQRSRAEQALRQAQKMEAIGQLTGGIAHDFNNMLAVVIGGLNLLQRRLARGETDVAKYIDGAIEGATRAASLTQRLLAFARQQPLAPEAIDANRMVAGMTELLMRTLGEEIKIETVLSAGLWKAKADPNELENAILNLAVNARDAMKSGGKLTIETANAHIDDAYAAEFGIASGQYGLIAVTDTGVGMPPEVIARAFDPFFTTKSVGKGTGLGLSQVFGFVSQSGGHVKIYSEVGHGTTVKIYLPRFYGDAAPMNPKAPPAPVRGGDTREIVLVVEDEERVRSYSIEALRELGYTVVSAEGGAQALRMIDDGQAVTLLFTDIVMPDMTGRQLADLAVRKLPHLKVLFTTGYSRNAVVHNGVLDPGTHFLPKPFGIEQLASKIRSVLDS